MTYASVALFAEDDYTGTDVSDPIEADHGLEVSLEVSALDEGATVTVTIDAEDSPSADGPFAVLTLSAPGRASARAMGDWPSLVATYEVTGEGDPGATFSVTALYEGEPPP